MAGPKSALTFSSLQKYTRKRQLYAKNGFYLAIHSNGEVTGTSDESCLYAVLQFLSVGPDLVAIWGLKAKKYLAVDNKGKIFATEAEKKDCVFREFFGKNFFNIFRTCHSDTDGKGWYLSIDEQGRVSAEKVAYSDEPRLHFIVKTIKNCKDKDEGNECSSNTKTNNSDSNKRQDKKTKKDFGLPSSEIVWIMHPYQFDGSMSDVMSSTPSPPSSQSCISGSSASTEEWTGSGDNSTSV